MSNKSKERVKNGTHHLLSGEIQKRQNEKRVKDGTHQFLKKFNTSSQRVKNGTHHLLSGEIQRKSAKERVKNGTHNFLIGASERNNRRVKNGTHNFLTKNTLTAINIETGVISRISTELYHKRKDIYFTVNSKKFKEWKQKNGN